MLKIEWVPHSNLHVSVRDTGVGIKQEDIAILFQPFSKLADSVELNKQGCGLGLSISNQLIQAMGGSPIQVQSTLSEGSLFYFTLPITEPPTSGSPMPPVNLVQSVLVVDDNTFNTEVIKNVLAKMKVTCDTAHSGTEAIQLLLAGKYDAVLMDLEMPGMSGFECLRRLKELRGEDLPPVFAHSGDNSSELLDACKAAGFQDFIEKPAPRSKLQALLLRSHPKASSGTVP
jgi:CheY-like chemotaxis protein